MLRHYFLVFLRNLTRNRLFSGIIISGLALGLSAFLLITAYVRFEESYDRIHPDGERIFRVESLFFRNGQETDHWPTSTNGYAPAMKAAFPEVEDYTRIAWRNATRVVRYEQTRFRETHVCFADSNFFTFFGYPILKGDKRTFLKEPNTVVISEAAARRYFGHTDPLNKYLDVATRSDSYHCRVTGVFAALPANSTMQFDMLMSWTTSPRRTWDFWYQHESYTFVRLRPQATAEQVEAKFPAMAEKYKTAETMRDHVWAVDLVPLHDIHLNPARQNEIEVKGNRRAVQFLSAMAFVILIISWVNAINLSTARAMDRAREIGIRKAVGSHQRVLIGQLLFESVLFNLLALVPALGLVGLALTFLPDFLGLQAAFAGWTEPRAVGEFILIFGIGVIVCGLYPAFILSRVRPALALKGKYLFSPGGVVLRKGLVVVQFTASMVLIVGTFVAYRQLSYMTSQDPGVVIDQILVVKVPVKTENYEQKTESFRNELKTFPEVTEVTGSGAIPGKEVGQNLANRKLHDRPEDDRLYEMLSVDYDFIRTYDLKLVAGRGFDRGRPADQYGLVLNESAVKQFGFASSEQAIGQKVLLEVTHDRPNEVIGVVRDYHQQSLQKRFSPTILFMDPDYRWIPIDYYSLKISSPDMEGVVRKVQAVWNRFFPESSMDYFFLDDFFDRQYRQDRQFGRTFLLFSSLAIFIACMGLFGLTSYSTARRAREIGVRKALGASVPSILRLLAWDTLRLVLLAGLLAVPLSWYLVDQWLQSYAFRIGLTPAHWLLPMAALAGIALLTISYLSLRAALANPTRILRSE
ncbi:ABC transporter permease [Larkinella soli]|uniref:ABC transporter permease n=1 Tax=Larkinella soli TaxID=1770527 RepID=UPI000FFC142E|nr:ABC transporter permease [Larkinella soli]